MNMKQTLATTILGFNTVNEGASAENAAEVDLLSSIECDEDSFNRILTLERKRSERSKRPFMLMLLSLAGASNGEIDSNLRRKIISSLASCKRDTDVLGWYRTGSVIGIIFTEICKAGEGDVSECITDRVRMNLASNLGESGIKKINVSVYIFPEKLGSDGTTTQLTLYPDVRRSHDLQKTTLFMKRVIDIVGSLAALMLFSPLFLVIAALIKLTSEGPVLFRQKRVGQYGKTFTFLKFRSMFVNNDATIHKEYVKSLINASENGSLNGSRNGGTLKGEVFKLKNDPRVTPIGRFIRKTSLDELPQFINVLRGEMSLVGPRPPIPYELEDYDLWHRRRVFDMKPGITGVWQVEGRSRTTFNDMVRLDIYYITNWSLWLDLKLMFKTPMAVLTSKGAY